MDIEHLKQSIKGIDANSGKSEETILNYLGSIQTKARTESELFALKELSKSYSLDKIASALSLVLRDGLPPYGKFTYDPIADLLADQSIMKIFQS